MLRKKRDEWNHYLKSSSSTKLAGDGEFVYGGAQGRFSIEYGKYSGGRVVVRGWCVDNSEVAWLDRSSWERGAENYLRQKLGSKYDIAECVVTC